MYTYSCTIPSCKNEIIPCLHSDCCNKCKQNIIKNTVNNISKNIPPEIINEICKYINNEKEEKLRCIYCRKYICYKCYAFYNIPWCCNCYITYN